mmetsp:Transcript_19609/g.29345  ORF Transcript_19609/g.29345 Transcript_19609/m.29345 type:complete len:94 (+) Transcript_19609:53-334(+)
MSQAGFSRGGSSPCASQRLLVGDLADSHRISLFQKDKQASNVLSKVHFSDPDLGLAWQQKSNPAAWVHFPRPFPTHECSRSVGCVRKASALKP